MIEIISYCRFDFSDMSRYLDEQSEYLMDRNGAYGTYPGRVVDNNPRGILRKASDHYARPWTSNLPQTHSFASEISEPSTGCGLFLDGFLRPAISEFISVFTAIFLFLHVNSELNQRHIATVHRISILALVDAISTLTFMSAFKTVHLNPCITVAQLFSLSTSWFICGVLFLCQLAASTLAVAAHHLLTKDSPKLIAYNHDVTNDQSVAIYKMIVCQLIGTLFVVICHLLSSVTLSRRAGSFRLGAFKENPLCLFCAVGLSTMLNQLHSTMDWNPLTALASSFFVFISGDSNAFSSLYLFWLGPIIGGLLACFLFRMLFTNDERRLFKCGAGDTAPNEAMC
ncbi:hypothetical protein PRIPAC_96866 [Pristionchus pacificus]|uniref:Uncharacterized protein n=1 Tax=Pristionchus pacificus TaxID=54126 RepID=A0A2A6B3E0_PRIPA|nr:hypothetical protein PRIPAC_96866 [Pristionchus pacificus]|eukprot:PDM60405.1 hypothetical protein PRIPAC_54230 [Pristionchus pacificus]